MTPASPADHQLGILVLFVPVAGGILVGFMARYGSKSIRGHGDVRIIAATNQPLELRVKEGRFREDRFRVVTITLPPLRERREDLPLLADYFLKQYAAETGKAGLSLSPEAIETLSRYDWPGNVRELQHAIEQAVVLTTGRVILREDLPLSIREGTPSGDALPPFPLIPLDELQRRYVARVLREVPNRGEAARILGVDRRTPYRMARRYGIPLAEEKGEFSSSE